MESEKEGKVLVVRKQVTVETRYDLTELKRQLERIQQQRDAELAEVKELIAEAEKLGVEEASDQKGDV